MSKTDADNRCYDSLNAVTPQNKEEYIRKIDMVKPEKLQMFKMVAETLNKNNIKFWLDGGTLLGAYRNGEMIPHDLDMDLAIFGDEDLDKAGKLLENLKPEEYTVRYGHFSGTPAKKIELFKTGYSATHPETIWIDIVMYSYNKEEDYVWTEYFAYGFEKNRYKFDWIFPLGTVMFEGMEMSCPKNSEAYLTELYGYLGKDCFYNTETQKYEKR